MKTDYLIIGSGLTGAVIARKLADAGRDVLVLERRNHVGGNVHDYYHPCGIRIHTYGPHYFRTESEELWNFVNRFTGFYKFEAVLKSDVDDRYENWPVASSYIRRVIGENWQPEFTDTPGNFEEASLAMMPRLIYDKFVKGYTEKQWGVPAVNLAAGLAGRFDVREDDEPRLKRHRYQGIPTPGYAVFMQKMLEGIPVLLNVDYLKQRERFTARNLLVFTGPIDEYFGFALGKLRYRGQKRETQYYPDETFALPCEQVNNPSLAKDGYIRTLEWKHMLPAEYAQNIQGTVLTREFPYTPEDPEQYEYPFPDEVNALLYKKYLHLAEADSSLLICGRLGEYRYYDMDQAIARASLLANRILSNGGMKKAKYEKE